MDLERRTILQAGGVIAVGGLVAACSTGSGTAAPSSAAPAPTSGTASTSGGSGAIATVSQIPVGGGVIIADPAVVITQPAQGEIKAFTAICTHQGCLVGQVADNEIICPCHGSRFSGTDGSVVQGPATTPLGAVGVTVQGDSIVLT